MSRQQGTRGRVSAGGAAGQSAGAATGGGAGTGEAGAGLALAVAGAESVAAEPCARAHA